MTQTFFDSFGISRLTEFRQSRQKTLVKFLMIKYKNITKKKISNELSTTAVNLFGTINEFGKKHKVDDEITVRSAIDD